jgi:outer membrane protein assembly factor BamB
MLDKNGNHLIDEEEAPSQGFVRFIARADKDGNSGLNKQEWDAEFAADRQAGALRAIRLGGRGDVTDTHQVWRYARSMANVPSPLLYREVIYSLRNGGILTALDARTGQVVKQGRLKGAIDGYYASPVAADGKIYALSETGKLTVIRAGREWKVLGAVELGEEAYASPALSAGSVFIRTMEALYRFGGD